MAYLVSLQSSIIKTQVFFMPSFLLLGPPRAGTTYVGQILSHINKSSLYLSEPIRSCATSSTLCDDIHNSLKKIGDLSLQKLTNKEFKYLQNVDVHVGIKETLRLHDNLDRPSNVWTNYISSFAHYEFSNVYVLLRHPFNIIESTINRFGMSAVHPQFRSDRIKHRFFCDWIENINLVYQFARLNRLQILLYEELMNYPLNILNPSISHDQSLSDSSWQKFLPYTVGIGDQRALLKENVKVQKEYFSLSSSDKSYVWNKLCLGLRNIYK